MQIRAGPFSTPGLWQRPAGAASGDSFQTSPAPDDFERFRALSRASMRSPESLVRRREASGLGGALALAQAAGRVRVLGPRGAAEVAFELANPRVDPLAGAESVGWPLVSSEGVGYFMDRQWSIRGLKDGQEVFEAHPGAAKLQTELYESPEGELVFGLDGKLEFYRGRTPSRSLEFSGSPSRLGFGQNGATYLQTEEGAVLRFDRAGNQIWAVALEGDRFDPLESRDGQRLYVRCRDRLVALSTATGDELWSRPILDREGTKGATVEDRDGNLAVMAYHGEVHRFDPQGGELPSFDLGTYGCYPGCLSQLVQDQQGHWWASGSQHNVQLLSATGERLMQLDSQALFGDENCVVQRFAVSEDGNWALVCGSRGQQGPVQLALVPAPWVDTSGAETAGGVVREVPEYLQVGSVRLRRRKAN